jgi:quercetin dioxygenase-like cupin family protein
MRVEKWDKSRWGELTEDNMRKKLEWEGYSVTRVLYSSRTLLPDHTHSMDKKDAVVSGRLKIEAAGEVFLLEAGDMIALPAGMIHNAKVIGSEPVVSLDASQREKRAF